MTNSVSARYKYNSFDLLKLLLAYFVVAIHSNMNNHSSWIEYITYTAVPIFFSSSVFLMYPRHKDVGYIKNYCLKISKLYFLWTATTFRFFEQTNNRIEITAMHFNFQVEY